MKIFVPFVPQNGKVFSFVRSFQLKFPFEQSHVFLCISHKILLPFEALSNFKPIILTGFAVESDLLFVFKKEFRMEQTNFGKALLCHIKGIFTSTREKNLITRKALSRTTKTFRSAIPSLQKVVISGKRDLICYKLFTFLCTSSVESKSSSLSDANCGLMGKKCN